MLLPRFLTAMVGGALFLAAIYFGSLPYLFVVLGITLLGVREFYFLAEETGYPSYPWVGLTASLLLFLSVYLNGVSFGAVTDNQATGALLTLVGAAIVVRSLIRGPSDTTLSEWSVTFFGVFYVTWTLSHLLLLRDLRPQGRDATYLLVAIIWTADTLAYVVGSRWGAHKIAPRISPNKSWEGTLAGMAGGGLVGMLFQMTVLRPWLGLFEASILGIVVAGIAFLSDLGESMLKRGANVKDSSPLLPGHGGLLDRFDSFFLTAPLFYYFWAFLKH